MVKSLLKKIISVLLKFEARLVLKKYKPKIIGITGTVGKTSAKDAIYTVLQGEYSVRKSEKSYNSELGVPLTILGAKTAWNNIFGWLKIFFDGARILIKKSPYPEWLVLEMGIDRPGDMAKLIRWVKPRIGVVTALGETPVHIEFFKNAEDLFREKEKLIEILGDKDFAVLNGDDKRALDLMGKTKAQILTYGVVGEGEGENNNFDIIASSYKIFSKNGNDIDNPEGIIFKLEHKGNIVPVKMPGFGKQIVYSALAAAGVGVSLGINLVKISEALGSYKSPPGRLNIIEGIKNSLILDDTYNASPLALAAAIDVLNEIHCKRRVAILGDMLELGKYTAEEHRKVGAMAKKKFDILVAIGPRAKLMAEEARASRFGVKKIFEFQNSEEAKEKVAKLIQEGDLVLVKGSQGMRMERVVKALMAHPEEALSLLTRQEKEWKGR